MITPVSKDNPRRLMRVSDGSETNVSDPGEYLSLTSAHGYRDITDEPDAAAQAPAPAAKEAAPAPPRPSAPRTAPATGGQEGTS